jgi:hypothetical protein
MGTTDGMGPIHYECGDLSPILLGSKIKQLCVHVLFICHYHFTVKQSRDRLFHNHFLHTEHQKSACIPVMVFITIHNLIHILQVLVRAEQFHMWVCSFSLIWLDKIFLMCMHMQQMMSRMWMQLARVCSLYRVELSLRNEGTYLTLSF